MTVILLLTTFAVLIAFDYFKNRNKQPVLQVQPAARAAAAKAVPLMEPSVVAGFKVQEGRKYHPGHTWAVGEGKNLVRIGIDDFAAKLAGPAEAVKLPERGKWIRQGQKIAQIRRDDKVIELVSPIEGCVADVNDRLANDPRLMNKDCYGDGWLLTVDSPDAKTNFRNLLDGKMVKTWTDDCAHRLAAYMATNQPIATMADGGIACDDLAKLIPAEKYEQAVREFFL